MTATATAAATELAVMVPRLGWEELARSPSLDAAVARCAAEYDFRRHSYFHWLAAPRTSVAEFRASQVPFRFAVESFSQSLAAVLARVPRVELRLPLADNVAEEHGRGNLLASHKATFLQYLRALGASDAELERGCPVAVSAFNQSLLNFCLVQPYDAGAALLGIIEHLYVGISATIARTLDQRRFAAPGSQRHYAAHETLDVSHARELLVLAEPGWQEPRARAQIALGLLLGAHWFWTLYRDLQPAS